MIIMYTDGACLGNPGPGGWAALILNDNQKKIFVGYEPQTTNNRMEMMGILQGLTLIPQGTKVKIFSDSQYVVKAFEQRWIQKWQKNGWLTAARQPVKNKDLWMLFSEKAALYKLEFSWVKGHSGDPFNEMCDVYAKKAIDAKKSWTEDLV